MSVWKCCGCSGTNLDANAPTRCPVCSHYRCDTCKPPKPPACHYIAVPARTDVTPRHISQTATHDGPAHGGLASQHYCNTGALSENQKLAKEQTYQAGSDRPINDNGGNTTNSSAYPPPDMTGWWTCHNCGLTNNPTLAPTRCSTCGHFQCSGCYVY